MCTVYCRRAGGEGWYPDVGCVCSREDIINTGIQCFVGKFVRN